MMCMSMYICIFEVVEEPYNLSTYYLSLFYKYMYFNIFYLWFGLVWLTNYRTSA